MTHDDKTAVQGEGDYISGKKFQDEERAFAANGPVKQKAREAAEAIDGPEGVELEAARRETAKGRPDGQSTADKK